MDQFDLCLAHPSSPRPDPLRPCHDGQSDEAGRDRSGMVVSGRKNRCGPLAAQVRCRADGAGPTTLAQDQTSAEEPGVNGKEPERQTAPEKEQQNTTKTVEPAKEQVQTNTSPNCT